ncbi:MAG: cyclic nucleotide-binding domain-containing protein [Pseudomonadota bacterium]
MRSTLYEAEQVIFREGDPSKACYRIVAGSIDIVISCPDGGEKKVTSLGPEEVFGEMGIIDDGPRSATAIAREPTCCEVYAPEEILDLMTHDPDAAMQFLRTLILRLRSTNRKLAAKTPLSPPRRPVTS